MQPYQIVEAKTAEEALAKSEWKLGDIAECVSMKAIGNSNGTFSLFATFKKPEKEKRGRK